MIARDAEHTLGACLDSVRPWIQQIVCCVDELTTDATADVARAHGADVVVPIKVSDWHECEQHGRVLAQHFGQARNESFTYLDASLDAYLWIDADDILDGGEHLAEVLAGCPDDALGYWVPYVYASAHNHTAINTVFDRERLLQVAWGYDYGGDSRTVDVHVTWLREKLAASEARIQTVWSVGYKLVPADQLPPRAASGRNKSQA